MNDRGNQPSQAFNKIEASEEKKMQSYNWTSSATFA